MSKSNDLSKSAKAFYKTSKSANSSCCVTFWLIKFIFYYFLLKLVKIKYYDINNKGYTNCLENR